MKASAWAIEIINKFTRKSKVPCNAVAVTFVLALGRWGIPCNVIPRGRMGYFGYAS